MQENNYSRRNSSNGVLSTFDNSAPSPKLQTTIKTFTPSHLTNLTSSNKPSKATINNNDTYLVRRGGSADTKSKKGNIKVLETTNKSKFISSNKRDKPVVGRVNTLINEGIVPTKPTYERNIMRGTVAKKLLKESPKKEKSPKIVNHEPGALGQDQWEIEFEKEKKKPYLDETTINKTIKTTRSNGGDTSSMSSFYSYHPDELLSNWTERLGRGKKNVICDVNGKQTVVLDSTSSSHWYIMTFEDKSSLEKINYDNMTIELSAKCLKHNDHQLFCVVIDYCINKRFKDEYISITMNCSQKYWKIEKYESKKITSIQQEIDKQLSVNKIIDIKITIKEEKLSLFHDGNEIFRDVILPYTLEAGKERRIGVGVYQTKASFFDWKIIGKEETSQQFTEESLLTERPLPLNIDRQLAEMIKKDIIEEELNVKWDDISELEDAKRLLKEAVVLPLLMPEIFDGLRRPCKGILLYGPPGTGKTLLARAVASEGKTTFFNCSASTLVSKYHGESERLVKCLFQLARLYSPSTIFFDEIDALMMVRGSSTEHEASRRLKSEILSQIDGINSTKESLVMVLATTNKPWDLDDAMRRRLEKRIYISLPNYITRKSMLRKFLNDQDMESDISFDELTEMSDGYSGADIYIVCREAAMIPLRRELEYRSTEEIMKMKKNGELKLTIRKEDFVESFKNIKSSVSNQDLEKYVNWTKEFGSV
ncbi:hypothetical protein ABK040_013838 [Willaertia magna]